MGFEYDKFKVQVKLAISRISSLQQRHQNSLCGRRKEIADLLKAGQEERARLLVLDDFDCCDGLHLNVVSLGKVSGQRRLHERGLRHPPDDV
jgi:hypothetical protein